MTPAEPGGVPTVQPATDIGDYLVSSRSLVEYRAVFALTDADLRGRVLDCPGGGSGATAALRELGTRAWAVDPVDAVPADELSTRLDGELASGRAWTAAHADRCVRTWHGDPAGLARTRAAAAARFTRDLRARPAHFVAAALPRLPLRDGAFDLVLSSHLLSTYADRLDAGFHRAALREMARVSRGEVRVYPLIDQAGRPLPGLVDRLVGELRDDGLRVEVREVDHEFQRGARHLLRAATAGPSAG